MKSSIKFLLKLIGTLFLVFILFQRVSFNELLFTLKSFKITYILFMLSIMFFGIFLTYLSLYLILNTQKNVPFFKFFNDYLLSLALGTISPARVGDFSFAFFIRNEISIGSGIAIIFINKMVTVILMFFVAIFGFFILFFDYFKLLLLAFFLIVVFVLFLIKYSKRLLIYFLPKNVMGFIKEFYSTFNNLFKNHKFIFSISCLIMFGKFCLDSLLAYFLLKFFGVSVGFLFVFFIYSLSVLASLLPISLNGIGIREIIITFIFEYVHLNPVIGITVFFTIFVVYYTLIAFLPLFYLKKIKNKNWKL